MLIWALQYSAVVLAVFGVAFTMAFLHGPFGLCHKLREAAKKKYGPGHWVTVGLACPICLAFWLIWLPLLWVTWPPALLAVASWWAWYGFGGVAAVGIVALMSK